MKEFFKGWGIRRGSSMMLGWIGVWGHCKRMRNCQSLQPCFITHCEISVLACSASQSMPSHSAHSWALCKNVTRKYKNETVMPVISILCYILTPRWTPYVTQTIQCVLCLLQNIVQILIYSDSNIGHLLKQWIWTNSPRSYDVSYKYTMWILLYNVHNIHGSYEILNDIYLAHKIMVYEEYI